MSFKFLALFAFVTVASAGALPVEKVYHQAPNAVVKTVVPVAHYAHPILVKHGDQHDPQPQYKYAYDINDEHTGDVHSQKEERDGDVVHGEYSLIDADGYRRVVQYTVDPHSGFNAVVNRIPLEHQIKSVVKAAPAPVHFVAHTPTTNLANQYPVPVAYHQHH